MQCLTCKGSDTIAFTGQIDQTYVALWLPCAVNYHRFNVGRRGPASNVDIPKEIALKADTRIDGDRLWESLMMLAQIGATQAGGVNRQALTLLDKEARELFAKWCREAGCVVRVDPIGNIFA